MAIATQKDPVPSHGRRSAIGMVVLPDSTDDWTIGSGVRSAGN
jgi:hypothetical protein